MFNNNTYYTRYSNNPFRRFGGFNPTFNPYIQNAHVNNNFNNTNTFNNNPTTDKGNNDDDNIENDSQIENNINPSNETNNNTNNINNRANHTKRFGPINFNKNEISIFGFTIAIDDLILIGLILLLLLDTDCDYALLIVLGLILFNIDFSGLNLF